MNIEHNITDTRKKINLTSAFSSAINLPRHKDAEGEYPLYPHSDGSKIQLKRSPDWHKRAATTYNSPTNARVVCLSRDGANVLYWVPPVKGGKPMSQSELAGEYVFDTSAKSTRQSLNPMLYQWEKAGLRCLVEPVVFSNIEELWIAVELLACPAYERHYEMLMNIRPGQVVAYDILSAFLSTAILAPSKPRTIATTFPLLRSIVVVVTPPNAADFHKYAVRTDEIKAVLEAGAGGRRISIGESPVALKMIAAASGLGLASCPITSGDIRKFSLGDYLFDDRYLAGVKDSITAKYAVKQPAAVLPASPITQRPSATQTAPANSVSPTIKKKEPMSELEPILISLVGRGLNDEDIRTVLLGYASEYSNKFLADALTTFTDEGKKRFGGLFPIT